MKKAVVLAGLAAVPFVSWVMFRVRVYRLRWRLRNSKGKSLPSPDPTFIVGNRSLKTDYYKTLREHSMDGPATLFWIGSSPFLVVNTEEGVHRALSSDRYSKPRYVGYRSRMVRASVEAQSDVHLTNAVDNTDSSRKRFQAIVESRVPGIIEAMKELKLRLPMEGSKDIHLLLQDTFVRLNLLILFDFDGDSTAIPRTILSAGKEFSKRMLDPLRALYQWKANIVFFRDVLRLIKFGRKLVAHLDTRDNTWVHAWVTKKQLSSFQYFGKILGLVMASTQTVPLTSLWMLHLLASYPQVRHKVEEEMARVLGDRTEPTLADLGQLTYLGYVVSETLRMYPPFPLLQREALVDDNLEGFAIPVGTKVYVVPWLIHRHSRYWHDPDEFRPERFAAGPTGDSPSIFTYLPFGRGPRMCAGYNLAVIEMKLLACMLLRDFTWVCDPPREAQTFPDVNMFPRPRLSFTFTPKITTAVP